MSDYRKSDTDLTAKRYQEREDDGDRHYTHYECSNCGEWMSHTEINYCPNCGARFIDKWYKCRKGVYVDLQEE